MPLRHFFSLLTTFLTATTFLTPVYGQPSWEKISANLFDKNFEALTADSDGKAIFVASDKNLYRSLNGGNRWEHIFSLHGNNRLNFIRSEKTNRLFLLSTDGVFKSEDKGKTWSKIFSAIGRMPTNSLSLSVHPQDPEILFLGTAQGLFWSLDGGKNWASQQGPMGHEKIGFVLHHPTQENVLFLATAENFYRSKDFGKSFEKTFHIASLSKNDPGTAETAPPQNENESAVESTLSITSVKISPIHPQEILMGTLHGIYASSDLGKSWSAMTPNGLGNIRVKDLEISSRDGAIFAATEAGVYTLAPGASRWIEIYEGLSEKSFESLKLVAGKDQETLFAASKNSIFKWYREWIALPGIPQSDYLTINEFRMNEFKNILQREPSIQEVQNSAIRYADVTNSKIKKWHRSSKLKAFLPDFSVGKNLSIRNNVDVDRGGSSQPDLFILGPDSNSKGQDIRLDWKLSNFIFSSDQTSIDSREKLMVELRSDVLSEVTRLYFERRRLLMDLYLNRPETNKEYLELLLRIDELTAYLDGLTGGYFAKELQKRKINYH